MVITDNSLSELADKGDLTLYADIDSTFFAHSLVGPISLVSALAAAIYSHGPGSLRRPGAGRARPRCRIRLAALVSGAASGSGAVAGGGYCR